MVAEKILLQVSQYVYLEGSLSFCQGPVEMVEVATGLPADAASLVGSLFSELVQLGANEAWDSLPASITGWMTETATARATGRAACRRGRTRAICGSARTS